MRHRISSLFVVALEPAQSNIGTWWIFFRWYVVPSWHINKATKTSSAMFSKVFGLSSNRHSVLLCWKWAATQLRLLFFFPSPLLISHLWCLLQYCWSLWSPTCQQQYLWVNWLTCRLMPIKEAINYKKTCNNNVLLSPSVEIWVNGNYFL